MKYSQIQEEIWKRIDEVIYQGSEDPNELRKLLKMKIGPYVINYETDKENGNSQIG